MKMFHNTVAIKANTNDKCTQYIYIKRSTLLSTITLAFLGWFKIIILLSETGINTIQIVVIYLLNGLLTS